MKGSSHSDGRDHRRYGVYRQPHGRRVYSPRFSCPLSHSSPPQRNRLAEKPAGRDHRNKFLSRCDSRTTRTRRGLRRSCCRDHAGKTAKRFLQGKCRGHRQPSRCLQKSRRSEEVLLSQQFDGGWPEPGGKACRRNCPLSSHHIIRRVQARSRTRLHAILSGHSRGRDSPPRRVRTARQRYP